MISFMLFVFLSIAALSTQLLKSAQSKATTDNVSLQESSIIQALRAAYYQQYWIVRLSPGPPNPPQFQQIDAITALHNAAVMLGNSTNINDTVNSVSFDLPRNVHVTMTLLTPGSPGPYATGFTPFVPGQTAPVQIDSTVFGRTGSWLGTLFGRVHPLPVLFRYQCSYGLGNANEIDITRARTILFCEVPQKQVALLAEQNVSVAPSGNVNVQGSVRVKGNLDSTINVTNGGSIIFNDTATGNATLNSGMNIRGGGGGNYNQDFRFQTEIQNYNVTGQNTVRSAAVQSLLDPVRIIPTADACREGRDLDPILTAAQQQLYNNCQPFYNVPTFGASGNTIGYRIYGAVDNNPATFAPSPPPYTVNSRPYAPPDDTATAAQYSTIQTSYSLVAARAQNVNGTDYTILEVDPSALIASGAADGKALKLFIAGYLVGTGPVNPDYTRCIVSLAYVPRLQIAGHRPRSFTIITPNPLVFEAAFNYDIAGGYTPVPASYIAPSTSFGFPGTGNDIFFAGSVHSGTTGNTSNILQGKAASGQPNTAGISINLQNLNSTLSGNATYASDSAFDQQNMSGGEMLFVTLPTQQ